MSGVWRRLVDRFWALPLACALAALGLGLGLSELDDAFDTALALPFLFGGGPEGARALLSAINTSMIGGMFLSPGATRPARRVSRLRRLSTHESGSESPRVAEVRSPIAVAC